MTLLRGLPSGALLLLVACGDIYDPELGPPAEESASLSPSGSRVFLAPNVGGLDYLEFFRQPHLWPEARARLDVFKLYNYHLADPDEWQCGAANGVNLHSLLDVGAFDMLRAWGKEIAVETGVIKPFACTGQETAQAVLGMLRRARDHGITVDYLAMDEPMLSAVGPAGPEGCGLDRREAARRVADHIRTVRAEFPHVAYGSMDAYPFFSVHELVGWYTDIEEELGRPLDFVHLDVDFNHVKNVNADLRNDFPTLANYCRARGVPFGPMTTANEFGSPSDPSQRDRFFYDTVMRNVSQVRSAMGRPDEIVLPSWFNTCGTITNPCSGTNCLIVPSNLPDASPYTFTRLLIDAVDRYESTDPPQSGGGGGCAEELNLLSAAGLGLVLVAPLRRRRLSPCTDTPSSGEDRTSP